MFFRYVKTFLLFLILVISGCSSKKAAVHETAYQQLAYERYGERVEYLYNQSRSHVICLTKNEVTPKLPQQHLRFFLYDIAANTILLEDEIQNGSIAWKNNWLVVAIIIPGTVKIDEEDKPQGWQYDVQKKSRNPINPNEQ
ncbi:MAG: hypothetical protein V1799_09940 [bacterium]